MKRIINHFIAFLMMTALFAFIIFYFTPLFFKTAFFSPVVIISLIIGASISSLILYIKFTKFVSKKSKTKKKGIGIK